MAENETTLRLTLEAVNKSDAELQKAKKQVEDLQRSYEESNKKILTLEVMKGKTAAEQYFKIKKEAADCWESIQRGQSRIMALTHQATAAHDKYNAALAKTGQEGAKHLHGIGDELASHVTKFVSIGVAIEAVRRGFDEYAKTTRGMERVRMETGATVEQVEHLKHSFETLAGITGRNVQEMTKDFRSFADVSQLTFHETEELFLKIEAGAHAAGTSVPGMAKAIASALNTLKVPLSEVDSLMGMWIKTVPASMQGAFSDALSNISPMLRAIGIEGKGAAEQFALNFASAAREFNGDIGKTESAMASLLKKVGDYSTPIGKRVLPNIEKFRGDADATNKMMAEVGKQLEVMGLLDDNMPLAMRSLLMKKYGVTETDIALVRRNREELALTKEIMDKTGLSAEEAGRRIGIMNKGPQRAADEMNAKFKEMYDLIGEIMMATGIPNHLADILKSTLDDIKQIIAAAKWFEEKKEIFRPSNVTDPAMIQKDKEKREEEGKQKSWGRRALEALDPRRLTDKETIEQERLRAEKDAKEGTSIGNLQVTSPEETAENARKRREAEKAAAASAKEKTDAQDATIRETIDRRAKNREELDRRRKVGRGFARGGEFTVPGAGASDDQPVEFMATPGEKVSVDSIEATKAGSLQAQQDKADQSLREHFARFHDSKRAAAFTPGAGEEGWSPTAKMGAGGRGTMGAPGGGTGSPGGGGGRRRRGSTDDDPKTTTTPPVAPTSPTSGPGYNIGPYGQPMPAWGERVTEAPDYGGGIGKGVTGDVPGLPGSPSGRALTPEERKAAGAGAGAGGGDVDQQAADAAVRGRAAAAARKPMSRNDVFLLAQKEVVDAGLVGKVPADGARYGITKGTKEEWAHFFTQLAHDESGYKPWSQNEKDRGGSQGLLQVSHLDNKRYKLGVEGADTREGLHDPVIGMRTGVKLFTKQGGGNKVKGTQSWGPINTGAFKPKPYTGPTTDGVTPPPTSGTPGGQVGEGAKLAPNGQPPASVIIHHTSGRGGPESVVGDWRRNRPGVGAQFIVDRDGVVHDTWKEYGYSGTGHIQPTGGMSKEHPGKTYEDLGAPPGLSNKNTIGIEVVASNDKDVQEKQIKAVEEFIAKHYPNTPVRGHEQVNPGHREKTEGMTIVNRINAAREAARKGQAPPTVATTPAAPFQETLGGKPFTYSDAERKARFEAGHPEELARRRAATPTKVVVAVPKASPTQGAPGSPSGPAPVREKPAAPVVVASSGPGFRGGRAAAEEAEGRQHGGNVYEGQPYKVGEDGEEIFLPGKSGYVAPIFPADRAESSRDRWKHMPSAPIEDRSQGPDYSFMNPTDKPNEAEEFRYRNRAEMEGGLTDALGGAQIDEVFRQSILKNRRNRGGSGGDWGGNIGPPPDRPEIPSTVLEPVIRPRLQMLGGNSPRWTRHAERQRQYDTSRDQARMAHTDAGFG